MSFGNIHYLGVARKDSSRAILLTSYTEASKIDDDAIVRFVFSFLSLLIKRLKSRGFRHISIYLDMLKSAYALLSLYSLCCCLPLSPLGWLNNPSLTSALARTTVLPFPA